MGAVAFFAAGFRFCKEEVCLGLRAARGEAELLPHCGSILKAAYEPENVTSNPCIVLGIMEKKLETVIMGYIGVI